MFVSADETHISSVGIHVSSAEICISCLGTELSQCKSNNYSAVLQQFQRYISKML